MDHPRDMLLLRFVACRWLLWVTVALGCAVSPAGWADVSALQLVRRIELPGTQGRLDHLAIDLEHQRLFVAALGADALEVVDLATQQRASEVKGRSEPQGVAYSSTLRRLFVANGGSGSVEAFEGTSRMGTVKGLVDADNLRLDPVSGNLYVGYGHGLAVVDPGPLRIVQRVALPGHPEAFEIFGARIYVNVPTADSIVVLERASGRTIATWPMPHGAMNFAIAIDDSGHRLFVAARRPAALHVFDTESGRKIVEKPLCGDADDLFWDSRQRRLYAVCGEGAVAIVSQRTHDEYELSGTIATAAGARTGLFVPDLKKLFVAVPARNGRSAAILIYSTTETPASAR